jgi:hypothetical protein
MSDILSRRGFLGALLAVAATTLAPAAAAAHGRSPPGWARPQPRRPRRGGRRLGPRRPWYHDPRRGFRHAPAPRRGPARGPFCLRRSRRGDWVLEPCR